MCAERGIVIIHLPNKTKTYRVGDNRTITTSLLTQQVDLLSVSKKVVLQFMSLYCSLIAQVIYILHHILDSYCS